MAASKHPFTGLGPDDRKRRTRKVTQPPGGKTQNIFAAPPVVTTPPTHTHPSRTNQLHAQSPFNPAQGTAPPAHSGIKTIPANPTYTPNALSPFSSQPLPPEHFNKTGRKNMSSDANFLSVSPAGSEPTTPTDSPNGKGHGKQRRKSGGTEQTHSSALNPLAANAQDVDVEEMHHQVQAQHKHLQTRNQVSNENPFSHSDAPQAHHGHHNHHHHDHHNHHHHHHHHHEHQATSKESPLHPDYKPPPVDHVPALPAHGKARGNRNAFVESNVDDLTNKTSHMRLVDHQNKSNQINIFHSKPAPPPKAGPQTATFGYSSASPFDPNAPADLSPPRPRGPAPKANIPDKNSPFSKEPMHHRRRSSKIGTTSANNPFTSSTGPDKTRRAVRVTQQSGGNQTFNVFGQAHA